MSEDAKRPVRILVVRDTQDEALEVARLLQESFGSAAEVTPRGAGGSVVGRSFDVLDASVSAGVDLEPYESRVVLGISQRKPEGVVAAFAKAGEHFRRAADAGRASVDPCHARWALELYRECQRDAEGDPWFEPGGAERRFIARLREYAGAE